MKSILTVTFSPALDVCTEVPAVEPDHKLHCLPATRTPGGGGINVARAIRRLGEPATALFPYGGSSGAMLCELLDDEGVPTVPIPTTATTREDFAVRETNTGHEYRFVVPGPALTTAELQCCTTEILRRAVEGSIVVISGSMPPGVGPVALEDLVGQLRDREVVVIADTSGPGLAALARTGVFLLKPSANELSRHARRPLPTFDDILVAAEELRATGPSHAVVVSLGADGAVLVEDGQPPVAVAAPRVRVISAVGAGDSLVGGLALSLAQGSRLGAAVRMGVAAGTAATVSPGHHLCDLATTRALLADVRATPVHPNVEQPTGWGSP